MSAVPLTRGDDLLLRSPAEIVAALGSDLDFVRTFDRTRHDRATTASLRRGMVERFTSCAACGESFDFSARRPEAAHIVGIYGGGGTTSDNLVLLCSRPQGKGCHQLFDRENAARPSEVKEAWRRLIEGLADGQLRSKMLERARQLHPEHSGGAESLYRTFVTTRRWNHAERLLRAEQRDPSTSARRWVELQISLAVIERRRGMSDGRRQADRLLALAAQRGIPDELRSLYEYELGYLRRIQGRHTEALQHFEQSLLLGRNVAAVLAGRWNVLLTQISMSNRNYPGAEMEREAKELLDMSSRGGDLAVERWHTAGLACLVNTRTAVGNLDGARDALATFDADWSVRHCGNGRVRAFETTTLVLRIDLRSRVLRNHADAHSVLHCASKVLNDRLIPPREFPISVRDCLFVVDRALQHVGALEVASRIASVAARIEDGTPLERPYKHAEASQKSAR